MESVNLAEAKAHLSALVKRALQARRSRSCGAASRRLGWFRRRSSGSRSTSTCFVRSPAARQCRPKTATTSSVACVATPAIHRLSRHVPARHAFGERTRHAPRRFQARGAHGRSRRDRPAGRRRAPSCDCGGSGLEDLRLGCRAGQGSRDAWLRPRTELSKNGGQIARRFAWSPKLAGVRRRREAGCRGGAWHRRRGRTRRASAPTSPVPARHRRRS